MNRLSIPGILLAVGLWIALTGCAVPDPPPPGLGARSPSARGLVLIAHGVEARADSWPLVLERAMGSLEMSRELWDFHRVDWYEASLDRLAAPRIGYELGMSLGRELSAPGHEYQVIHLIGHSAGAHVVQGILDAMDAGPDGTAEPAIQVTLLDPFVARSVVQLYWGVRHFAAGELYAENYVTRDDKVPFTNSLLRNAYNFDLSALVVEPPDAPSNFAHMYPTTFYQRSGRTIGRSGLPGLALSLPVRLGDNVDADAAREVLASLRQTYPPGDVTVLQ